MPSDLQNGTFPPSEPLAELIDIYWSIRNDSNSTVDFPVVPDGCTDIIRVTDAERNDLLLIGPMQKGIIVTIAPGDAFFGIRFRPGALAALIEPGMHRLTDKALPLRGVSEKLYNILAFLLEERTPDTGKLNRLFETAFSNVQPDDAVQRAAAVIREKNGDIGVGAIAPLLGISGRQLERRFRNAMGYSPKTFARIIRFFTAHKQLCEQGTAGLSSVAFDHGYCDQAHFNREFKSFTLLTPTDKKMSIFYNTTP